MAKRNIKAELTGPEIEAPDKSTDPAGDILLDVELMVMGEEVIPGKYPEARMKLGWNIDGPFTSVVELEFCNHRDERESTVVKLSVDEARELGRTMQRLVSKADLVRDGARALFEETAKHDRATAQNPARLAVV